VAGRASIVGAAATHVGKVREHNEDAHFIDAERGVFLVCDGMGGHAAGEVASALAIRSITQEWASDRLREVIEHWLELGTGDAKKQLIDVVRAGVLSAHDAILSEADRDDSKTGMGTTLVGAMIVGGELMFAHAGDSRAYLVRDGISMQLTEDHTLLARLLAAGIDVDVSGEGSRFRSMLTNALGIGEECKVSTFLVPLADGDRFLLCSDGISEYVPENEVGDVLTKQPSPARAAQRLIDLALDRGGGDNATAIVVRVLEAGETPLPAEQRRKDEAAINACTLWVRRLTPQQRLRARRITIPRDHAVGDKLPAHTLGDRVAWIIVEGELVQDGATLGPGAFVYPESLVFAGEPAPLPDRDALAVTRTEVRALAIRADDFRELCDDDTELGEALLEGLGHSIGRRTPRGRPRDTMPAVDQPAPPFGGAAARGQAPVVDAMRTTDPTLPNLRSVAHDGAEAHQATDPNLRLIDRSRAATVPDAPGATGRGAGRVVESATIAPAPPRASAGHIPTRPSPLPMPAASAPSATPTSTPARTTASPVGASRMPVARGPSPALQTAAKPSGVGAGPRTPPGGTPPGIRVDGEPVVGRAMPRALTQPTPAPPLRDPARANPAELRARAHADTLVPPVDDRGLPPGGSAAEGRRGLIDAPPRGFARPLAPPSEPRPLTPLPLPAPDSSEESTPVAPGRLPSDPEIETYLEMEADLPPESGLDADLESELALSIVLSGIDSPGDPGDEDDSISITIDEGVDDDDETEPTETGRGSPRISQLRRAVSDGLGADEPTVRKRAITAQDGSEVSGTIDRGAPSRAKRHSEGFEERSEEMGSGDPGGFAAGARGKAPRGID
jgi:serine/threonine protein phosphatase PrpC